MRTMRELFLGTLTLADEAGERRGYDYYITIDEMEVGSCVWESYGIGVTQKEGGERAAVRNVTCSGRRIHELGRLVMEGGVTPVTLRDVVEDWL